MALPTRSAAELNAFLTSYSENYLNATPLNQAWEETTLLNDLLADAQEADGGNELVLPVMDGATANGGAYGVGSDINLVHQNPYTQVRYQFTQVYEPMYIDDVQWDRATGAGAKINLLEQTLDYTRLAIRDNVETMLCAASTGTATDGSSHINSIVAMIDSTGALGGLNPATAGQTWWAAYENSTVGSFLTNGPTAMNTAFLGVTKYQRLGMPNAIYASITAYQAYEASGLALQTNMATGGRAAKADIGIGSLSYKGIPIKYVPRLDDLEASLGGVMLWVNSKALKLVPKAGKSFTVRPWTDLLAGRRFAKGSAITFTAQAVVQSRACLAKMAGIEL